MSETTKRAAVITAALLGGIVTAALLLTQYIHARMEHRYVATDDLSRIRRKVSERDNALSAYKLKHFELDVLLSTIYAESSIDRLQWDIDLRTGEFIPYREGRRPDAPPSFTQNQKGTQ